MRSRRSESVSYNSKDGVPYRVVELFSGIGAQRMALMEEGIPHEVVGISEIDRFALRSYEAIYGDNPNLGDITKLEGLPASDILTYSFPCTDLSGANPKKTGMARGANQRSSLLWEVQRLLEESKARGQLPKWLVMENVPAVFSKANRADFDEWVAYLGSLGYTSEFGTLNAKDFGTAQNRNRAYMISRLGDYCPPLPVGNGPRYVLGDVLEEEVPEEYFLSRARLKGLEESNRKERDSGNGFRFRPKSRDEVASTVTTRAGSRKTDNFVYDDGRIRKLTPLETWRLQGFPDWAFDRSRGAGISDTQLYHQAGNSIAVPVMGAIMCTIDDCEVAESEGRLPRKARKVTLDRFSEGSP